GKGGSPPVSGAILSADARLPGGGAAALADPQAARDGAWPSRAAADGAGCPVEHQAGEATLARLVGMGQHPPLCPQTGLDAVPTQDDAPGRPLSFLPRRCAAGVGWVRELGQLRSSRRPESLGPGAGAVLRRDSGRAPPRRRAETLSPLGRGVPS